MYSTKNLEVFLVIKKGKKKKRKKNGNEFQNFFLKNEKQYAINNKTKSVMWLYPS